MNAYQALVDAWNKNRASFAKSEAFAILASGRISAAQYAAVLRQIFHQTRENPQLQALVTTRFRGEQRELIKTFYRHASSEIGHDQLALADIAALGFATTDIPNERPLPATFALLATAFHTIEHHDPVAYLGYLFHLEYTPVQLGAAYMEALERAGIPRSAMTFIEEHAAVDVSHCKLIEQYCETLIRTPEQLEAVLYMQRLTAELYARMLDEAIDSADRWEELSHPNPEEVRHREEPVAVV
jgi:pyrroloquinoline quinone (PQQ) biosynthesis protein C